MVHEAFSSKTIGTVWKDAGFAVEQSWTDFREWYAVTVAGVP
jgi:hypothetical protein